MALLGSKSDAAASTGHSPARDIIQFRVAEQQLAGPQISCALVDESDTFVGLRLWAP